MVSLRYAITKEDYVNYYAYVTWDAPGNAKKRLIYYARQILPILLFIFAFYYTGLFERNSKFILLIVGFLIATSLLSLIGVRTNAIRQAEKIADDPGNSSIFLEAVVVVNETGITVKDELMETKYQWKAFTKKLESQNYYFIFHNSIQALIIPKRVFNTTDQKLQFEKLLGQYISLEADVAHLIKSK